jgi:hypothetical protein
MKEHPNDRLMPHTHTSPHSKGIHVLLHKKDNPNDLFVPRTHTSSHSKGIHVLLHMKEHPNDRLMPRTHTSTHSKGIHVLLPTAIYANDPFVLPNCKVHHVYVPSEGIPLVYIKMNDCLYYSDYNLYCYKTFK